MEVIGVDTYSIQQRQKQRHHFSFKTRQKDFWAIFPLLFDNFLRGQRLRLLPFCFFSQNSEILRLFKMEVQSINHLPSLDSQAIYKARKKKRQFRNRSKIEYSSSFYLFFYLFKSGIRCYLFDTQYRHLSSFSSSLTTTEGVPQDIGHYDFIYLVDS